MQNAKDMPNEFYHNDQPTTSLSGPTFVDGGVDFRVWAPERATVHVVLVDADGQRARAADDGRRNPTAFFPFALPDAAARQPLLLSTGRRSEAVSRSGVTLSAARRARSVAGGRPSPVSLER